MKKVWILFLPILILIFMLSGCSKKGSSELRLTGTIEADKFDITSEISGKLISVKFNEGDRVKANDIAAVLDTSSLEIQKKQAEASVNALNSKLLEMKAGPQKEQVEATKDNLNQISSQIRGQKKTLDVLLDSEAKIQNLYNSAKDPDKKQQLYSQLTEIESKVYGAEASIDTLNAQYDAADANLKLLIKGATTNSVNSASSSVDQAKASLDLINLQIAKSSIKSPKSGTVIYKLEDIGQVVTSGMPILTAEDLDNLWIKFYIPEKSLNKIKLGEEVRLISDISDGKTYTGKIIFISPEGEFTPKNVQTKEEGSKVYYAFKVKITSGINELKPGMMLDTVIE